MRSHAVLELGSRLVSQLKADDDLLASWMAHYIAELIDVATSAPEESKASAQEACSKAILELWQHRSALPQHLRPFADVEPVLRTLVSLDLENSNYRYYSQILREAATADANEATQKLLKFAINADLAARLMIASAIRSAAKSAAASAQPWVDLAMQAGAEDGIERSVIEFASRDGNEEATLSAAQEAARRGHLSRLEAFIEIATSLASDLRGELRGKGD